MPSLVSVAATLAKMVCSSMPIQKLQWLFICVASVCSALLEVEGVPGSVNRNGSSSVCVAPG
jgi:hypothetical protein